MVEEGLDARRKQRVVGGLVVGALVTDVGQEKGDRVVWVQRAFEVVVAQDLVDRAVADDSSVEVAVGLSASSREEVDALVDRAISLGGSPVREPQDEGYMYGRSFYDLDGHLWELIWMDPAAVSPPPATPGTSGLGT